MDIKTAKSRLAKQCSTKEVCSKDALDKLIKWELSLTNAYEIVDWLIAEKFIDDSRYACFYVRDKYRFNKWGRIKIKYALKVKNIPSHDINIALKEIDDNEYKENLFYIIKNKLKSTKENDPYKLKSKIFNNATSKGFEPNLILEILKNLDIFKN